MGPKGFPTPLQRALPEAGWSGRSGGRRVFSVFEDDAPGVTSGPSTRTWTQTLSLRPAALCLRGLRLVPGTQEASCEGPSAPGASAAALERRRTPGSGALEEMSLILMGGEGVQGIPEGKGYAALEHVAVYSEGIDYKTTTILLDGRRVKLQLWDTSGQGRFCTIFRSYSRGAQGVILVYDIANRWSFDGIDRWIKEIDEHAPGVPKILVGNRLHLAFKRQVPTEQAQAYAERLGVTFFEVSPLCNFNITESFTELARIVLLRHGMDRLWRPSKVLSLQDLCCRAVVSCTPVHLVDKLPLPIALRSHLKSFSMANGLNARMMHGGSYSLTASSTHKRGGLRKAKVTRPPQSPPKNCTRNSCKIS
ncbi:PREDICTED: ras-related protein Rab-40B [Galeopterus variegatus]|uniref:small monomeric GTPase n=1 Tax=Galeopterus variegatus TaxID=482537 RepID=A0ABM0RWL9_GALVR|nr:PREDICTED: ras-related protein Rab-40B [Galeopterus variegatus]